jgi:hypothetical protein
VTAEGRRRVLAVLANLASERYPGLRWEPVGQDAEQRGAALDLPEPPSGPGPDNTADRRPARLRRRRWNAADRARAFLANDGLCGLCGEPIIDLDDLELDHILPLVHGGADHPSNLQPAHSLCNRWKGRSLA